MMKRSTAANSPSSASPAANTYWQPSIMSAAMRVRKAVHQGYKLPVKSNPGMASQTPIAVHNGSVATMGNGSGLKRRRFSDED